MAFSRAQVLFLISCTRANGTAFAPPASGSSQIPARDRVHIDNQVNDLVAGTWRSVNTVPANKWLVITDFDTSISGIGEIAIAEFMLEKLTTKRERYFVNSVITSTVMDDIGSSFSGYLFAD
jgi:hypothetical protein